MANTKTRTKIKVTMAPWVGIVWIVIGLLCALLTMAIVLNDPSSTPIGYAAMGSMGLGLGAGLLIIPMVLVTDKRVQMYTSMWRSATRVPIDGVDDLVLEGRTLRRRSDGHVIGDIPQIASERSVRALAARLS